MRVLFGFIISTIVMCFVSDPVQAAWGYDPGHGYAELKYSSPSRSGSSEKYSWQFYGEQGLDTNNTLLYQVSRYKFSDNSTPAGSASGLGDYKVGIRHQTKKTVTRAESLELEYHRPIGFIKDPIIRTDLANPELEIRYDWGWGFRNYWGNGFRQMQIGYRFVDGNADQLHYKLGIGSPFTHKTSLLLSFEGYRSTDGAVFDHWIKAGTSTQLSNNSVIYVNRFMELAKNTPKGSYWEIGIATTY